MTFFLVLWLITFVVLFTAYFLISQVVDAIQQRRWDAKHEAQLRERQERVEAWHWPTRTDRRERTSA